MNFSTAFALALMAALIHHAMYQRRAMSLVIITHDLDMLLRADLSRRATADTTSPRLQTISRRIAPCPRYRRRRPTPLRMSPRPRGDGRVNL